MADSIRDRIKKIQTHVLAGTFTPAMARDYLMQLTALYGAVIEEHLRGCKVYLKSLDEEMRLAGWAMTTIEIAATNHLGGVVLHIPDGWDQFTFRGQLYVKVDGQFLQEDQQPSEITVDDGVQTTTVETL